MHPLEALRTAERPLFAFGAGVRNSREISAVAAGLGIPIVVTWGAKDLFPEAIGTFGTHGVKAANLAVQNCDWFVSVGTRLDTKATGIVKTFAPKARRWMVDIDPAEIAKFHMLGLEIEGLNQSAEEFFAGLFVHPRIHTSWSLICQGWKKKFPPGPGYAYEIMRGLSKYLRPDDTIVSDTGCVVAWAMQALDLPRGCRFIHAWNMTPMGYGLPASIGAAFATCKRVILLTGDGGLNVNITELATLQKHQLPIKILLFNNLGHGMCRQTQRQWLDGKYFSTGQNDLATPNFEAIARAYGLPIHLGLKSLFSDDKQGFLEFHIPENEEINPQVKFGEPLA